MGGAVPPRTKPSSGGIIDGNADSLTIWPCSKGPFRIPTNPANAGAPARTASGSNDATSGVAVHPRHLLPNPDGAEALQNHPAGRVPQHTLRALAESGRRAESSQHGASPGW
jgi:hypothetical protein